MNNDFRKALNFLQSGKLNEAKKLIEEVLKNEKNNSQALNLYAFVLYYQNNFNAALEQWQKAIKIYQIILRLIMDVEMLTKI
tara:strand:- start:226 stop:471 length:246 start_codon:yes stop_codon:yes gene_type:complete